jgi:hypothetical protein
MWKGDPNPLPSFPTVCPKSSPSGSVSIFWPKPTASLSFHEPATLPPLPPCTHLPTTSSHGPLPSFLTVYLKSSPSGSVSRFWPKSTTSLPFRKPATLPLLPPHTHLPTTSPHHPPLSFLTACPKLSPGSLISGFWLKLHLPCTIFFRLLHAT